MFSIKGQLGISSLVFTSTMCLSNATVNKLCSFNHKAKTSLTEFILVFLYMAIHLKAYWECCFDPLIFLHFAHHLSWVHDDILIYSDLVNHILSYALGYIRNKFKQIKSLVDSWLAIIILHLPVLSNYTNYSSWWNLAVQFDYYFSD